MQAVIPNFDFKVRIVFQKAVYEYVKKGNVLHTYIKSFPVNVFISDRIVRTTENIVIIPKVVDFETGFKKAETANPVNFYKTAEYKISEIGYDYLQNKLVNIFLPNTMIAVCEVIDNLHLEKDQHIKIIDDILTGLEKRVKTEIDNSLKNSFGAGNRFTINLKE